MAQFASHVIAASLALVVPAAARAAQLLDTATPPPPPSSAAQRLMAFAPASAERYEPVFDELRKMAPRADRVATVRHLTLRRDVIEFRLEDGKLYLATPVAGRTVGAIFVGRGSASFAPPLHIERTQLEHLLGDSTLDVRITALVLVFTDSTLAELERQLVFGAAGIGHASDPMNDALDRLVDGGTRRTEPTLMTALLNGDANGFVYAHIKREHGEDLMFLVDPEQPEQIALLRGGRLPGQRVQIVCQFPRVEDLRDTVAIGLERPYPLKLEAYKIDATVGSDLAFSATATLRVTARRDGIRWMPLRLFEELKVDSVSDEAGTADTFFRPKRSEELWVRLEEPVRLKETRSLRVVYHGDLISYGSLMGRFTRGWTAALPRGRADSVRRRLPPPTDQWFFIKSTELWFPRYAFRTYGSGQAADMDLTFHTPNQYRFASIGRLVESHVEGDVRTTHWLTERPALVASFNVGPFREFQITDPRIPPVTVQVNAEAHMHLRQLLPGERDPQQLVGGDVANSLAFFTKVFGPPLFAQYYATEIPYGHGQAFPGLIHLSFWTFLSLTESGADETFRAHEMAHQWWGIGVEPASYRDAWLSEGFAEFAGLWYMQLILNDNDKFLKTLRDRRKDIRARRGDVLPIGLGVRAAEIYPRDYQPMIYSKGAWVLQMLRNMLIDFRTMKEDAFTAVMQDFYQEYRGRRAATRDFQRVVERHVNVPMGWFFDEWVDGTAIPTYILSWHAEPTPDGRCLLRLRVRQEDVPTDFEMPVPLRIEFPSGKEAYARVHVRGPVTEGQLTLPTAPQRLELNPLESVLAEVREEGWH